VAKEESGMRADLRRKHPNTKATGFEPADCLKRQTDHIIEA